MHFLHLPPSSTCHLLPPSLTTSTPTMAAAAAAAVGSCFSSSITRHFRSKLILKLSCPRALPPISTLSHFAENISLLSSTQKRGLKKRLTAVEQEEVTAVVEEEEVTAVVEEEDVVSVEEVVEEIEGGGGEAQEVAAEPVVVGDDTKLYFGNLPYNVDSAILAGVIQEYATPEMIEVLYDRDTGRSRGFAFVTMSSIEDCETVIQNLDGKQYAGRTLRVNLKDKPKPKVPLYPESEYKLFVGNLSWSVTSESLTKAFQGYGNVVGARVLYDGDTGRSRGYGFVCFSTKEEMDAALGSLEGVELDGRPMRISLALGKRS